jgi:hypothetical protein
MRLPESDGAEVLRLVDWSCDVFADPRLAPKDHKLADWISPGWGKFLHRFQGLQGNLRSSADLLVHILFGCRLCFLANLTFSSGIKSPKTDWRPFTRCCWPGLLLVFSFIP